MSALHILHAFHRLYHKDAYAKTCLCRLTSGRCRIRACAAPGLVLLKQGLRLFSDHVASCCGNVRPEMYNDVIDPAHPIIVWVFGISYLYIMDLIVISFVFSCSMICMTMCNGR